MRAWIYARFSSLEQSKGNSIERQLLNNRTMCEQHGWEVADDRIIADQGRSAFHGANRMEGGALFEFERDVELGHYAGQAFVCEHLDRISRQGWEAVYQFLIKLTGNGVTVATTMNQTIYRAGERVSMADIIPIIVLSEKAEEDSATKARRTRAAWQAKHERARQGERRAISLQVPSWLLVDPKTREITLNPERAKIIRHIFKWSANGLGSNSIAKRLNEEAVPTFSGKGKGWQAAFITQILRNRAVLGEYQPTMRVRKPHSIVAAGERILDYYPPVIDADMFNRVQEARSGRKGFGGRRGNNQGNLFQGFARCGSCGGRMHYTRCRDKGDLVQSRSGWTGKPMTFIAKIGYATLFCDNALRKVRTEAGELVCTKRNTTRYEYLEQSVLDHLLHLAFDHSHFAAADKCATLSGDIAELERQMSGKQERLANLVDSFSRTGSKAMETMVINLEREVDADLAKLDALRTDLAREQGRVSPEEHRARVLNIREMITDPDPATRKDARVRVHQALSQLIERVDCYGHQTHLHLVAGAGLVIFDAKGNLVSGFDLTHDGREPSRKEVGYRERRAKALAEGDLFKR